MRIGSLRKCSRILGSLMAAGTVLAAPSILGRRLHTVRMEDQAPVAVEEASKEVPSTASDVLKGILEDSGDAVIVIDANSLVPAYQQKTDQILGSLQQLFPGLKTVKVTREEFLAERPDMAETLSSETFVVTRTKLSPELEQHDHYLFFMKTTSFANVFEELPQTDLPDPSRMNKFTTVLATCEHNKDSLIGLKKLAQSEYFAGQAFADLTSCAAVGAAPSDLILFKKNSQFNSFGDKYLHEVDGRRYDLIRLPDFFQKTPVDAREAEAAKAIAAFSVFTPAPLAGHLRAKYLIMLAVDQNRIRDAERKKLLGQVRDIATVFAQDHKDDVTFMYRPTALKKETHRVLLVEQEKQTLRLYYTLQNKSRETMEQLAKKYPFLLTDAKSTFQYRFDTRAQELTLQNFKAFFDGVREGKVECFRESGTPSDYKCSKRLVRDNFSQIFRDGKDHLVFFHSPHCHSCKRVSGDFESMALDNLMTPESGLEFNRVNVDSNSFYGTSPVIAYFKAGKTEPFLFQNQFYTGEMLRSFVSALRDVSFDAKLPENITEANAKGMHLE